MNKSIHPAVGATIVVIIVAVLVAWIVKGMGPHREPNAMSKEEIYKQMGQFNARLAGNKGAAPGASPGNK
jgi:hypothetical protein